MKTIALIALASFAGCDSAPVESLPACNTLTDVRYVSRCDASHARCALLSTAPAGASAVGCSMAVIAVPGGAELVECVEACP